MDLLYTCCCVVAARASIVMEDEFDVKKDYDQVSNSDGSQPD